MAGSENIGPDSPITEPAPGLQGRSLSDKVGVVFLGMGAGFLVHLVWGMALVRLLHKDGVGSYRQIWLVYGMASVVVQLGLPASIAYFVPQLPPRRATGFVFQVFALMVALGGLMGLLLFSGAGILARVLGNPSLVPLFRAFACYPVFFLPASVMPSVLIVENRHRAAALLQFVFAAQGPVIAYVLLALGYALQTVFAALALSTCVLFLGTVRWLIRLARTRGIEWRQHLLGQQMRYSLPIGLASAVDTLGRRLDQLVVSLFFAPARFAIYTVGAFEVPVFALLTSAIGSVLTPEFVRWHAAGQTERLIRVWHHTIAKMSLVILPTVVMLLAAAPLLIKLMYTEAYQESTILFRIYLLVLLIRVTQYSMILRATGRTKVIFWATVGFMASKFVLALALVKLLGFVGPAVASVIGYYIYVWLLLRQICKTLSLSMARVMPWRELARVAAVACVAAVPALLLLGLALSDAALLAIFSLGYGACYLTLGLVFGVFTREDLVLLRRWAMLRPVWR